MDSALINVLSIIKVLSGVSVLSFLIFMLYVTTYILHPVARLPNVYPPRIQYLAISINIS